MKYIYYLSLGANLGDRLATIGKAVEALGQQGESSGFLRCMKLLPGGSWISQLLLIVL